jgi:hypothetical protein
MACLLVILVIVMAVILLAVSPTSGQMPSLISAALPSRLERRNDGLSFTDYASDPILVPGRVYVGELVVR